MPWNVETYEQFKDIRYKPFFDLMQLITPSDRLQHAVDLGCGTGEQTSLLSQKFAAVNFLGIDASVEMLAKSKPLVHHKLKFAHTTIEEFVASETQWDLIFSNAALQWTDNHAALFPKLIAKLNPGGQFAVQMPVQKENALNQLLSELVNENPFVEWLNGFHRSSPVLDMDAYAQLLYDNGVQDFSVSLRIYPIIGQSEIHLCQFIAGSALIPYMERLDAAQQEHFRTEYVKKIRDRFVKFPALYPFKRILMHGFRA